MQARLARELEALKQASTQRKKACTMSRQVNTGRMELAQELLEEERARTGECSNIHPPYSVPPYPRPSLRLPFGRCLTHVTRRTLRTSPTHHALRANTTRHTLVLHHSTVIWHDTYLCTTHTRDPEGETP